MLLKIFVDSSDNELKEKYLNVAQVNNDNLLLKKLVKLEGIIESDSVSD